MPTRQSTFWKEWWVHGDLPAVCAPKLQAALGPTLISGDVTVSFHRPLALHVSVVARPVGAVAGVGPEVVQT